MYKEKVHWLRFQLGSCIKIDPRMPFVPSHDSARDMKKICDCESIIKLKYRNFKRPLQEKNKKQKKQARSFHEIFQLYFPVKWKSLTLQV